jgi:peptide/nickel transport system substrate-binding protein
MDTLTRRGWRRSPLGILMTANPGRLHTTAMLIGALGSALLAACAGEPPRTSGRPFVAAITNDPGHLNPAITTNGGVHTAAALLYDGLLTYDSSLAPQPALATRWEVEDAGARYRFHLRPGVRWHDGVPFTAADVAYTFKEVLLKYHARTRASLGPALSDVAALDDSTVEFRFRRPYAPLLQQLDASEAPIIPKHIYAGTDALTNPANTRPVGTGPYRFVSYQPNGEIRYAANRDYFGGAPSVASLVLRVIPDPGTQVLALEAGEVDWLFGIPGPERERLRGNPRIRFSQSAISPGGGNCITTIGFNLDRPWARDLRVRKAIAHAINRPQFVERVLFGEGRAADAPISSRIAFAHATGLPIPAWDTVRAARLLDSAGWHRANAGTRVARGVAGVKDGTPFVIDFKLLPGQANYGDLLRAQLRAVGVDVRVQPLDQGVFSKAVVTTRDFDLGIGAYCNGTDPEIGVRRMLVSSSVAPVPFSNMAGYRNPVVDSLFERAASALNVEDRRRFYRQIQEIVVRDQPYVWLVETLGTRAYNSRCTGFGPSSHFLATARCQS